MVIETWQIQGEGFHFGRQGMGQEVTAVTFPSDGLFAAIIDRLAHLRGPAAVKEFIDPFIAGDPPFVVSSTFPFAGNVRFFPAPLVSISPGYEQAETITLKELKRVQFISENLFRRFIAGETLNNLAKSALRLQDGQIWLTPDELDLLPADIKKRLSPVWAVERRPRVTISRRTAQSAIFFTGRVIFQRECGLWFALRWLRPEPMMVQLLADVFMELGTAGLGAERSAGFGACQFVQSTPIDLASQPDKPWVTLSRYLPRPEELFSLYSSEAAYQVETVGGWLDSPVRRGQRRRPVNLLAEGSILGANPSDIPGDIVDVRPRYPADLDPLGHPVYRSGMAFKVTLEGGD
jgi:CRISPR-associated protein Csm4